MRLIDVCEINPKAKAIGDNTEVSFVAMPDVSEDGKINTDLIRPYCEVKKGFTCFNEGDVLFAKITPCMENGKGALAVGLKNGIGCGSTEFHVLRPNTDVLQGKWLYYLTAWPAFRKEAERHMTGSAGQKRVPKAYLEKYELQIPTLSEQYCQIEVLDRVKAIIELRKQELQSLDELIKARFVELFETKQDNYDECHLEDVADIVSGITKGRKTKCTQLREVPYMAVSNVKDGYIDWTTVKTILATEDEIEQYRLLANDVLMTEGGDPDKVGRGSIISDPPEDCIHQNHIFRVRLDEMRLLPRYFATFLQSPVAKMYFLRAAKQTTGIASINMKQLRGLPTILPPLNKQREFVLFCQQVDKSKFEVQRSLEEAQKLFDSLMQEYFS